jgi:hypothetical protein
LIGVAALTIAGPGSESAPANVDVPASLRNVLRFMMTHPIAEPRPDLAFPICLRHPMVLLIFIQLC